MPLYNIKGPDGKTYSIEGPEGATREQVISAIQTRMAEQQATPQPQPKTGFFANLGAGFESLKGDIGSIGAGFGVPGAEAYSKQQQQIAAQKGKIPEFSEAPVEYVTSLLGRSVPYMVAPLAAAALAPETAALATIGRVALTGADLAATATSGIQFFGSNLTRQMQEGKSAKDLDLGTAAAAAPFQAALDTVGFRFIPGLRKVFGEAGVKMSDDQLREVMKARMTETLADKVLSYGTKTLQTAGVEGLTETGQQVLERAQAGLNISDPEARKEYFDSFVGGAVLGGTLAVPGTALERSGQQGQYEGLLRKDAAAAKEENRKLGVYERQTGVQQDLFGESTEGFKLPPEPYRAAEEKEGTRQNKLFQITELRDQHDVLMREVDRLKEQVTGSGATGEQIATISNALQKLPPEEISKLSRGEVSTAAPLLGIDPKLIQPIARAMELNTARADLEKQIKGLSKKLEGAERAGTAPEEGQRGLDFGMPEMPRQQTGEGVVLGEETAPPAAMTPEQTDFFRQERINAIQDRMAAGEMVTPADMAFLRMDEREQRALLEAQPVPQFALPEAQPDFRLGPQYLQPPVVEPAPAVETRPVTENDFKAMGIGRTNKKLREAVLDKDLADPVQRAEVREVLTDFANDPNRSAKIIEGVNNFLSSPTFMEQGELDLRQPRKPRAKKAKEAISELPVVEPTEPIVGPTEPSLDVAGERGAAAPGGFAPPLPTGLGTAPAPAGELDVGAPVQSTALAEEPQNVPVAPVEAVVPPTVAPQVQAPIASEAANVPTVVEPAAPTPLENRLDLNTAISRLMFEGKLKRAEATRLARDFADAYGEVSESDMIRAVESVRTGKSLYRERKESVAPGEGMSKEQVQAVVDDVSQKWENAPKMEVVQDIQELPQALYQQMVRDNAFDAPGLYDPNTKVVYLIADNIKNRADAVLTLAHETLGHYGLQSILGHTYGKMMDDIYNGNPKIRAAADQKIKASKFKLDQRTAVEEVLAEMAEKNVSNSAVQRVMNAIRQWLRKMGIPFNSVTDNEVRALLANANRFVHGGRFRAGEEAFGGKPLYREGAFDRWFGNSVVRNENGTPKVMYHGTARDIEEFRPKQANAIFVTDDPRFAESFSGMSEDYIITEAINSTLDRSELATLTKRAEKRASFTGNSVEDELRGLVKNVLPTRANIVPVYVSAQNPFDYENPAHVEALVAELNSNPKYNKFLRSGDARYGDRNAEDIARGNWRAIEADRVQDAIKATGYDGFYIMEGGKRNLAVYDSSQIKSVFNKGTYDPADKRILYRTRKEELTPEGKEAAELNERMKGAGNPKETDPDTIMKKMIGVVQRPEGGPSLEAVIRRELVDARATAVEKMQTKFNNTLVDSLGDIRGDLAQAQAQDHAALAEGTMEHGGIEINKDGLAEIVDRKATMAGVFDIMTKLGDRLGSLQTAMKLGHNAFIAQRAREINVHNEKIAKDVVAAEKKGNTTAAKKLRDMIIEHHVTDEEIAAGTEAMEKFPELKQAFDVFTEYKNGLIDFLVQTGRISKGKANDWKESAGYVPWTRVEKETNLFEENPTSFKGGVISIAKLPILDRQGSSKEIANVFDNMIGLTSWAVKTGMNAYASRRMVESLPDAFELTTQDAIDYAQKFNKDRLIFTYKDGERTAYLLGSALDRSAFASNIVALGPILKAFSFAQSTLRSFVTHMPAFALSQLIQDGTYRAMLLSGVEKPFSLPAKVAKNFIHAMAGQGIPLDLARVGVSGVYDGMPQQAMERARVKYGLEERGAFKKAWDKLEKFSLAADLAVRAAIYEQTINETKSAEMPEGDRRLALYRAKEYINFKHGGNSTVVGTMRHMVPFLNAYIQGMDVLYRTMRGKGVSLEDKRTAQKLFLATGLKIAAMSTIYAMLVGDDDDYKGLEEYERDKNYIIPGTGIKIPVAPEVGFMFKVIPERIVRYVVSQGTERPQDATAFYKGFRDAFINAYSGMNLTPQLVKPALEVAVNYSFFTGNPIVGMGMKNLDPSLQFTEGTSELAKLFGLVGISPMKADYLIRGYTGMLGAFVLDATDAVANPDRMGKPVSKLPQLSTFMYDTTGRGYKSEFYDFRESVDQVVDTVNMFKREGRVEELREYLTEDKMKLYAMKGVIHKAEDMLSKLRKQRSIIANDPQMPSDLKREKTDELLQREKELLLAYNIPKLRGMAGM